MSEKWNCFGKAAFPDKQKAESSSDDPLGVRLIDYTTIICEQDLFSYSANFTEKEPLIYSYHSPLTTWLNINAIDQNP